MRTTRPPALVHALVVFGVTMTGASISAQVDESYLEQAKDAIERVEYETAYQLLDKALHSGGRTPAELAKLYRYLGEVAATLGKRNEARRHFERLLTISPDATLNEGESPKIVAVLDDAKNFIEALEVSVKQIASKSSEPVISISVISDKLGLISSVVVAGQLARRIDEELVVDLSGHAAAGSVVRIEFLDEHDNTITQRQFRTILDFWTEPKGERSSLDPVTSSPPRVPLWRNPLLWVGLTGVAGATTGVLGLRARRSQRRVDALREDSNNQTYETYLDTLGILETQAQQTNVAIGVTVLAVGGLATSVVWWLTDRKKSNETTASVGVAAGEIAVFLSTEY